MMSSVTIPPLSPDFEVLYFKQKQGENLKDAWYRIMESYRVCTIKGDMKILLRNFYVGLTHPGHKNWRPKTEPEKTETEPKKTETEKTE